MSKTSGRVRIKPTIEDGQVTYLEVGYIPLPLTKPIPLDQLPDFISKLEAIAKYVNFGGESGWDLAELHTFIYDDISTKSARFFEIITVEGDWVNRNKILEILGISGRALAGVLSSPGQYFSRWNKDPIYENKWVEEKGEEGVLHYRIKSAYLNFMKEIFELE
ncbi:MAG: hypothetical protein NWE88_11515 [Candidatus Bathyarchaeota archaeon]|nr:hypothetical protein [Candidatus Bathyarchaeota archaeon]